MMVYLYDTCCVLQGIGFDYSCCGDAPFGISWILWAYIASKSWENCSLFIALANLLILFYTISAVFSILGLQFLVSM